MQQKIQALQSSVNELVNHKEKEQEEKSEFWTWQRTITTNIISVLDTTKVEKASNDVLRKDVKGLKASMEEILAMLR